MEVRLLAVDTAQRQEGQLEKGLRLYNRFEHVKISEMSKLSEIEAEISGLSRAEKAQVLQWVVSDLGEAFPGIESAVGVCGGEPWVVRTRIPVWLLVQAYRLGVSEADLLRNYPVLRAEDLANAWAYYRAHATEIEQQIRDNEAA
jgi:uncharacterized protein (DUF433 family)